MKARGEAGKKAGIWMLALLLSLGGCATQDYLGITTTPPASDQGNGLAEIRSFSVRAVDLPAFLGPIMVSNFSVALAERGLQPVMEGGDSVVTLRYVQADLTEDQLFDKFDERIGGNEETRFIARIQVEMRRPGEDAVLWQGSIQRLHSIRPGDYMHTGRASVALLDAFRDLLVDYPAQQQVTTE